MGFATVFLSPVFIILTGNVVGGVLVSLVSGYFLFHAIANFVRTRKTLATRPVLGRLEPWLELGFYGFYTLGGLVIAMAALY